MRKFIASLLLVFVFLPLALSALSLMILGPWLTSPDRLGTVFTGDRVEQVLRTAMEAKPEVNFDLELDGLGIQLDQGAAVKAILGVLPRGTLASLWDSGLVEIYRTFESQEAPLMLAIPFGPVKSELVKKSKDLLSLYLSGIPTDKNLALGTLLETRDFRVKPEDSRFAATLQKELDKVLLALPEQVSIPLDDLSDPAFESARKNYVSIKNAVQGLTIGLGIFAGLVLVGIAFLSGKEASVRYGFLGLGLAVPGLPLAGIGAMLLAISGNLKEIFVEADISLALGNSALEAGLFDMVRDLTRILGEDFLKVGALSLALGIGFLITRHFMAQRAGVDQ